MQIDAIKFLTPYIVSCNLYTGDQCVKITMATDDYRTLILDGFFIRSGKTEDSAGVMNTTRVYAIKELDDHSLEIE